jgi:hypothetical protein
VLKHVDYDKSLSIGMIVRTSETAVLGVFFEVTASKSAISLYMPNVIPDWRIIWAQLKSYATARLLNLRLDPVNELVGNSDKTVGIREGAYGKSS